MKLLTPRCEYDSYVKIEHAIQHLWDVNVLTYKEKFSYGAL